MSLNDREIGANKGVSVHPGVANPTTNSNTSNPMDTNFVTDPTTETFGAGAGPTFDGHKQAQRTFAQTRDVVEGRPGVLESTHIDPLDENKSNKDDGWANATTKPGGTTAGVGGIVNSATTMASGAAKMAYGAATGDKETHRVGKEEVFGKQ